MMNSKVAYIIENEGKKEFFSSLEEKAFWGYGGTYPTVGDLAKRGKVGITALSNILNYRVEKKTAANLYGEIDPEADYYDDLMVEVRRGEIIDPTKVFPVPSKVYTHGGVFHADETFACALLRVLNPSLVIERVFKSPETVEDHELVVDIGLGRFDHHQAEGVPTRPDGGKRATVGLIWDEVKDLLFQTSETQDRFETSYIVPVETQDNGGDINPLSLMIGAMNPTWDEAPAVGAERFEKAVCFFEKLIEREQEREASALRGQNIVTSALEKAEKEGHESVVVLEQFAPWQSILVPSKAEFVLFPSNRGGWNVQTVPTELGGRESKKLLPAQEEMEGCTFRHVGGFLASFPTKEEAVKAVL